MLQWQAGMNDNTLRVTILNLMTFWWGKVSKYLLFHTGEAVSYPRTWHGMIRTPPWYRRVGAHPHHISVHHWSDGQDRDLTCTQIWNKPITLPLIPVLFDCNYWWNMFNFSTAEKEISFRCSSKFTTTEGQDTKIPTANQKMPSALVMLRLILTMVGRKLSRNPNTYSSVLGLVWSLISSR